jgi:hypothetical protein
MTNEYGERERGGREHQGEARRQPRCEPNELLKPTEADIENASRTGGHAKDHPRCSSGRLRCQVLRHDDLDRDAHVDQRAGEGGGCEEGHGARRQAENGKQRDGGYGK